MYKYFRLPCVLSFKIEQLLITLLNVIKRKNKYYDMLLILHKIHLYTFI